MSTPIELLKTAAKVAAMDVFNKAMQREIEAWRHNPDVTQELVQIKYDVNKRFDEARRREA